jgi:acetylornithine deacetylase
MFKSLAQRRPAIPITINGVFIASEEAGGPGVGIDALMSAGKLEHLLKGPVVWVDCSDSQPCIGTAGAMPWHLDADGLLFHSGLPHRGINALEFAMEACAEMQRRFYIDFPPHPREADYNFATPSTMKPTQISVPKGGLNQLPPTCRVSGDIRLTPFYKIEDVKEAVIGYVADINAVSTSGIAKTQN